MQTMKKLFYKRQRAHIKFFTLDDEFNDLVIEHWGVNYSDMDADRIIDSMDYLPAHYSFEQFVKEMDEAKDEHYN